MTDYPKATPHGPIEELAHDVFWVQGSFVMGAGMRITRNMTIVRSGQELTVITAVRLSPEGQAELDRLGKVRHVVKIGRAHGVDDPYFIDHYGATYWAVDGGARSIDRTPHQIMRADNLPFADAELFQFRDAKEPEAALLVKRGGGILVTCDAVQHWPDARGCSPLARVVTRVIGLRKRPAQMAPLWRKTMAPEGGDLKNDFERLVNLPFEHLIGGHGRPLVGGAQQALKATFDATF